MHKLTERQKNIDLYLRAAVNLYGFVTPKQFIYLYNKYNKDERKLLKKEFVSYLDILNNSTNQYTLYLDAIINNSVSMMVILTVSRDQGDKKYYEPTKEEFLKYVNKKYYPINEYTQKLQEYLMNEAHLDQEKMEKLFDKLYHSILIGEEVQNQIEIFEKSEVFKEINTKKKIQEFLNLLLEYTNNTRQWKNCGFTAVELFEISLEEGITYQA